MVLFSDLGMGTHTNQSFHDQSKAAPGELPAHRCQVPASAPWGALTTHWW